VVQDNRWDGGFLDSLSQVAQESPIWQQLSWPRTIGRPDRLIRDGRMVIPVEHKWSRTLWPNHRAQVGVYLLLIEETWRVKPPHGFIECEDGRHCIENTAELRAWVLEIEAAIRAEPCRKGYHNEVLWLD
jgi:hypothetical protein